MSACYSIFHTTSHFFQRTLRQTPGFRGDIDFSPLSLLGCYSIIRFVIVCEFYARRRDGALIIFDRAFATKCHMRSRWKFHLPYDSDYWPYILLTSAANAEYKSQGEAAKGMSAKVTYLIRKSTLKINL